MRPGHKLKKWQWRHNFWCCLVSLVNSSYWFKFMSISSLFLELNPEIRNIPVWVFPNIWRMGRARDTKFSTNFSTEFFPLNAAKCHRYSFYRFWVIKGTPRGIEITLPPSPPAPHTHTHRSKLGLSWLKNINPKV